MFDSIYMFESSSVTEGYEIYEKYLYPVKRSSFIKCWLPQINKYRRKASYIGFCSIYYLHCVKSSPYNFDYHYDILRNWILH